MRRTERNFMKKALPVACAIAACAALFAPPAAAQAWPARAVKVVVPQAPGGATDVFARYLGQRLSVRWGQPVVIENKAGAAGVVGTDAVAKAPADGYTLLFTYAGSQAVNQSLYAKLPFHSVRDFQPVATVATIPFILVVGPDSPYKSFRELVAAAKAKPGSVTYATSGSGSVNHLLSESLKVEAGIDMVHVPYKAIAAAMTDVMGGQVDNAFAAVPSAIQLVRGGKLRALAVSSAKRNSSAPEIPTIAEMGYPSFDVSPWWGYLAPAGTPRAIVEKVNADVAEILRIPEVLAFFKDQGAEPLVNTPDSFLKLLEEDVKKWAAVVKSSGARID
jgi:tripartite-type tricarboxylate transporter receptor subunit TctC